MNIIYLFDFMENDINDEVVNSIIEYINTQPKILKYFNISYKRQKYKLSQLLPIIMELSNLNAYLFSFSGKRYKSTIR